MTYSDDMTDQEYVEYLDYDYEQECLDAQAEEYNASLEFDA